MKYSIFLIVIFYLLPIAISANVIYVNWDGSGDYLTIREGVDAAANGDTVIVAPGTYSGNDNRDIEISGKSISLWSEEGAVWTIIDCEGNVSEAHRGFYIHGSAASNTTIDGFTIENGWRTEWLSDNGGGIRITGSSPTITNCIIKENLAFSFGGGIYCSDYSAPIITNCLIMENGAYGSYEGGGGGVYSRNSSPVISNCVILENDAPWGGAGIGCKDSYARIEYCVISCNTGNRLGGGIYCTGIAPEIENCIIVGNYCMEGGGGIGCESSSPTITNCTLSENTTDIEGGGIFCVYSSPKITNCIFWDDAPNEIDDIDGYPTATYSDIENGTGYPWFGTGCIDENPLFADSGYGNFHLNNGSPCIDSGTSYGAPGDDFEGDPRPMGSACDMGADEHGLPEGEARITLYTKDRYISPGDILSTHVFIQSNFSTLQSGDFWMMATLPNQADYGPIYGPLPGSALPGYYYTSLYPGLAVPNIAPHGGYILTGNVGSCPDQVFCSGCTLIEVVP